ncbi:hypothetical protein BSKO_05106 [Bryopsis sp. KO-2023]|nr:hypothetical protein BSKO_05106 [Bryopsis sp. KO-2023]
MDDSVRENLDHWKKKYHTVFVKYQTAAFELETERLRSSFFEAAMNSGEEDTERYQVLCRKLYDALDGEEALRGTLEKEKALVADKCDRLLDQKEAMRAAAKGEAQKLQQNQEDLTEKLAAAETEAASHREELTKKSASMKKMEERNEEVQVRVSRLEADLLQTKDALEDAKSEVGTLATQLEKAVKERSDVMELLDRERQARADSGVVKATLEKEVQRLKEEVTTMMLEKVRLEGKVAQHSAVRGKMEEYTETLMKGKDDVTSQVVAVQSEKAGLQSQIQNLIAQSEEQKHFRAVAEAKVAELSAVVSKMESKASQNETTAQRKDEAATEKIHRLKTKYDETEAQRADTQKILDSKNQELSSLQKKISEQEATIAELSAHREDHMEGGVDNVLDRIVDVMGPPEETSIPPPSQTSKNAARLQDDEDDDDEMLGLRLTQAVKEGEGSPPPATKKTGRKRQAEANLDKGGPSTADENFAPKAAELGKGKTRKGKQKRPIVNRMFDEPMEALGGRTLEEVEARRNAAAKPFAFLPISQGTRSVASSKGTKRRLGQQWFDNHQDLPKRRTRNNKKF